MFLLYLHYLHVFTLISKQFALFTEVKLLVYTTLELADITSFYKLVQNIINKI